MQDQIPTFRSLTSAGLPVDQQMPELETTPSWEPQQGGSGGFNPFSNIFKPAGVTITTVLPDGTPVYSDGTFGQPGTATPDMVGKAASVVRPPTTPVQPMDTPAPAATTSTVPYKKIIEAGISALGTYLQGRSANKAIDAQTQANTQAQQQIQQAQQQQVARIDRNQETQRQLYSPYTSLGASAAGTLASRMGFPSTATPAPGMAPTTPMQPQTGSGLRPGTVSPPTGVQNTPAPGSLASASSGVPMPTPAAAASPLGRVVQAAQQQNATNQSQSGYVTMRAPDGTQGQVPQHQVEFYRQKGAQVVA